MIATLSGIVKNIFEQSIILEQSGIGFELYVPSPMSYTQEQETMVYVYMHWNQESGPTLYAFNSMDEKMVFLLIIGCSGIGPKIGLAILHQLETTMFLQAIIQEDIATLSSINGIGSKKAEQICVNLKHKVAKLLKEQPSLTNTSNIMGLWKDLTDTLASLGYSSFEIKSATNHLKETNFDANTPLSQVLRRSLAFLTHK